MGTLKLNAQRAIISLFGRDNQYVLAEATRTLSLQDDADHDPGDALWIGCCQLDYERSFCKYVFDLFTSGDWPGKIVMMVPNLKQDARFAQSCDIQGFPYARFFTSVPIISPKGVVIGAYTVLDKKPRTALDPKFAKFLGDMSKTVMDYLQMTRLKSQHHRAERMMVGIGNFLEGKRNLCNSRLGSRRKGRTASEDQDAMQGQINLAQQTKHVDHEKAQAAKATKEKPAAHYLRPSTKPEMEASSDGGSTTDSLSGQVADAFSRAANIAREAIEVEGVAYFDANFGSYGSLVGLSRSDSEFSGSESSTLGDTAPKNDSHDSEKWTKSSDILAYSTSMSSSVNRESVDNRALAISETLLKGLLHRYPRGKVFNFSEDGMLSSSDCTDGVFHDFSNNNSSNASAQDLKRTRQYKQTRQRVRQNDAKALLKLAPGARSIIFMPLWDSHKKRWYSGCIAWTLIPQRIFSLGDELTFFFGLGNSVMAEVHRLGAEYAEHAKSDLLSSLSHELRSPLHGVFGTVELLSDTTLSASQYSMMHAINSCASTLLDTIDHLLDYARINRFQQPNRDPTSGYVGRNLSSADQSKITTTTSNPVAKDVSDAFTAIQLDSILEQVVESVFAGYAFLQDPSSPYRKPPTPMGIFPRSRVQADYSAGKVKVILILENASSWRFLTDAGKWRIIVLNILGNALKFTSSGYVCVTLDACPLVDDQYDPGKPEESQVTLTVEDTGVGISKRYAREELFTAFSQENALSSGNGLGLHVTRRTVLSLGGEIKVSSQKGVGTKVVTKLNLQRPPEFAPPGALDMNTVDATREITQGKSIAILRPGWNKAEEVLCSSLSKICRNGLGMNAHIYIVDGNLNTEKHLPRCDYYIVTREDMNVSSITPGPGEHIAPPVIILCSSPANASRMYAATPIGDNTNVIEYISQPCGPHKLAKTLKLCSSNQQMKRESADEQKILPIQPAIPSPKAVFMSQEQYTRPLKLPEVRIPQTSPPYPTPLSPTQTNPDPILTSQTVLIVDDNEINVQILVAFMKKLAYEYVVARNGLEALDTFKADPARFKLILMGEYIYISHPHALITKLDAQTSPCQ